VAEFLVEIYLSRVNGVDASVARARAAADELTGEGTPVRYLSSIFVPEDETCFFLYQAASADAVSEAARRASLVFERVSEAVAESKGASR
jgi:Protein of unknown function (DUF4242)